LSDLGVGGGKEKGKKKKKRFAGLWLISILERSPEEKEGGEKRGEATGSSFPFLDSKE